MLFSNINYWNKDDTDNDNNNTVLWDLTLCGLFHNTDISVPVYHMAQLYIPEEKSHPRQVYLSHNTRTLCIYCMTLVSTTVDSDENLNPL